MPILLAPERNPFYIRRNCLTRGRSRAVPDIPPFGFGIGGLRDQESYP